jgi:hypothetical protein
MGMGLQQQQELRKPSYTFERAGDRIVPMQTNSYAGAVGQAAGVPEVAIGQSADNRAQVGASRANNADNISKDLLLAGVQPGGGFDANSEATAQAIAKGQLPPPTGMALLNPKNQRMLGRVMEINPEYDASTVSAKRAAATAFTTGSQGNALRSVSTASAHLDQLGELADAMKNGNTQVINKVANWYATQTGQPATTNFDAIKNIVGQEVVKSHRCRRRQRRRARRGCKSVQHGQQPGSVQGRNRALPHGYEGAGRQPVGAARCCWPAAFDAAELQRCSGFRQYSA